MNPSSLIYTESIGEGPILLFLHGWGMHGGLFRPIAEQLETQFNSLLIDLPGHGNSQVDDSFADIDKCTSYLAEQLTDYLSRDVVIFGWSTGSLIAQNIALHYPEHVKKLILVTATPCFENKADWSFGIQGPVLQKFNDELMVDFEKTLGRFLALQFMHSDNQKENLRMARELVFTKPAPDKAMLNAGLDLLKNTDLREKLTEVNCPTLIINGERDSLVPTMAARYMTEHMPQARSMIIGSCGHAPFLSHAQLFIQQVQQFLA